MRVLAWSSASFALLCFALACSGKYRRGDSVPTPNQVIECDQYLACGVDAPCDSGECIAIPGCGSAVCVSSSAICEQACGESGCSLATSYPAQLSHCPDGTAIRGTGTGDSRPPSVGTGGVPSQGGMPGGGYASGGYGTAGTIVLPGTSGAGGTRFVSSVLDCQAYPRCDETQRCAAASFGCVDIPGCARGICAPTQPLCRNFCAGECAVLDGYPAQLWCSTGTIRGIESGEGGVGGTAAAGGVGGGAWAGEPAVGGAPDGAGGAAFGGAP